jgi:hypothetical protein
MEVSIPSQSIEKPLSSFRIGACSLSRSALAVPVVDLKGR